MRLVHTMNDDLVIREDRADLPASIRRRLQDENAGSILARDDNPAYMISG